MFSCIFCTRRFLLLCILLSLVLLAEEEAKGWPADTFRKGKENPYLPRPVGDRERHTQQVFLSAVGGMCVCTVNCP